MSASEPQRYRVKAKVEYDVERWVACKCLWLSAAGASVWPCPEHGWVSLKAGRVGFAFSL